MCPKSLITATQVNISGGWDPALYNEMEAMIGVNQQITITLPTDDQVTVWGWIDSFEPSALEEGEFPTVDVVVEVSNQDNAGAEQAPQIAIA